MRRLKEVNLINRIKILLNKDYKQEVAQPEVNSIQEHPKINIMGKRNKIKVTHSLGAHKIRTYIDPNYKNIKTAFLNSSHINSSSNVGILPLLSDLYNPMLISFSSYLRKIIILTTKFSTKLLHTNNSLFNNIHLNSRMLKLIQFKTGKLHNTSKSLNSIFNAMSHHSRAKAQLNTRRQIYGTSITVIKIPIKPLLARIYCLKISRIDNSITKNQTSKEANNQKRSNKHHLISSLLINRQPYYKDANKRTILTLNS